MLIILIRNLCCINRNCKAGCLSIGLCFSCAVVADESWIPSSRNQPNENQATVSAAQSRAAKKEFKERLLQVDINLQQLNQTVLVLEDKTGVLYLWSHDLRRWRLRSPDVSTAIEYQGEQYFPLSAISDVSHLYNRKKLTLMIKVGSEAYVETSRTTRFENPAPPIKPGSGGFINYELLAANSPDSIQRSGQFEFGYFNRFGVGISNLLADNLDSSSRLTRLDSTWTTDYPERLRTLHLGDAVSAPGTWGRSIRFGGIQFGTNFGTQPGFVTSPPQSALGQAVLPSTVDVFINNALVSRQSVPPGPFSISNLPVITGAGEVQLVVRDLLGREQRIIQPFYGAQSLLQEGLEDFSYELGFVRDNFGINSNDYGRWLSTGTYRRGVSERGTGEVHVEAMADQATLGAGGDYLLPKFGTINIYIAGSQSRAIRGEMVLLGIDRQAQPWSIGSRSQWMSRDFTQIGLTPSQLPPVQVSSVNLSYAAHGGGSLGMAYVEQRNREQADTRIATLSYSITPGKNSSLNVSVLRNLSGDVSTTIFALFSIAFNPSTHWSVGSQSMRGGSGIGGTGNEFTSTLQHNLPPGEGYGYRLQARTSGAEEASYSLQNNIGTYTLDAAQNQGVTATRLNASGGIALLGGDAFMSRRIDQSFAVVRIADYPNVRVLADNQPAGRTDVDGNALIPRLRAYDRNVISIDQRDVPLDAEISTLKIDAVPYFRSGIDIEFPIKHAHGATLTIHLKDGKPLPVGTSVQEIGNDEIYTVGYGGELYVVDLSSITTLRASWGDKSCTFDVPYIESADPLPHLGTFICKEIELSHPAPAKQRFWYGRKFNFQQDGVKP